MASSKVFSRLSSRLRPLPLNLSKPSLSLSSPVSPFQSSASASSRRISRAFSRLPVELGSAGSLMPLHSAIASARLRSSLAMESQSWGLVPQGISMPL